MEAQTPAPAPAWAAPISPPVFWAHDFVDSVGADIHLLHPDSLYGSQFELVKQELLAARIKHVRDGAMDQSGGFFKGDQAARFQELGSAGIHVTFIFHLNVSAPFVRGFPARVNPAFEAYELPNELNLEQSIPWPGSIQAWMPVFYRYVKDNPATASYPIVGPSLADLGNDPYGQLGMQAQNFDYANLHKYYSNYNPKTAGYGAMGKAPCGSVRYGSLDYALCNLSRVSDTKPVICTESGYGTDVAAGNQVTPEVQAKFIARMLLLHLKAGVRRTFVYQFADYGADGFGAFGLLRSDGSEKPAFVELKTLMGELEDAAQSQPPAGLTLAVTRDFRGVETALFEKSDGSYRLVLWLEKPGMDPKTGAPLAVPSQTVGLSMPAALRARRLLTFGNSGAATVKQLSNSLATLEIPVQDNLTIVDIGRSGS
jgi:hypothetical protein